VISSGTPIPEELLRRCTVKHIDEAKLRRLYEARATVVDIAEKFGVCVVTVHRRLNKLGLSRERLSNVEDITGQIFNRLTALRFERLDKFGKALWLMRCTCGKEKVINASAVKAGLTTSCGCYKQHVLRQGVGDISQAYWHRLEKSAWQRDMIFQVTKQEAWKLFGQQNGKCALSGVQITLFANGDQYRLQTASLDRIDSTKGYTLDNIQWVHKRVNFLKRDYSEEELIYWCSRIAKKNKNRYVDITDRVPLERRSLNESITVVKAS
jgi:hypothetical protein